jgi:hypothetical protein
MLGPDSPGTKTAMSERKEAINEIRAAFAAVECGETALQVWSKLLEAAWNRESFRFFVEGSFFCALLLKNRVQGRRG